MMKKFRQLYKKEEGFTLIELLVVIAILSVLALLIIPRVTTNLDTAKVTTDEANVKLLQSAVERYHFDKSKYPTADGTNGGAAPGKALDTASLVTGEYIDEAPGDPWKAGRTYSIVDGVVQKLGTP